MDQFSERIQILIDRFGRKALSEKSRISTTQLHRLRGGADTTRENLLRLREATGVSLLWLAAGEGPMFLNDPDYTPTISEPSLVAEPAASYPSGISRDEQELIELYRSAPLRQKAAVIQMLSE